MVASLLGTPLNITYRRDPNRYRATAGQPLMTVHSDTCTCLPLSLVRNERACLFSPSEKKADSEDSPAEAAAPKEEEAAKQEDKSDEVGGAVAEASQISLNLIFENCSKRFTILLLFFLPLVEHAVCSGLVLV